MMNINRVYCKDVQFQKELEEILKKAEGPFLEVGSGNGFLTKVIPNPKILVDPFSNLENVIVKKIQNITAEELLINEELPKTLVSNLPFDQAIEIILHCAYSYPSIKTYYIMIQKEVATKMITSKKVLGFKMRHVFKIKKIRDLGPTSFSPRPKVLVSFLKLQLKEFDKSYLQFLKKITHPRKKLSHLLGEGAIFEKRISEKSDQGLYELYLQSIKP